jgi:polysaccharide export outer membrane protein
MRLFLKNNLLLFLLPLFLFSCASRKDLAYLNEVEKATGSAATYETVLQPDDLLSITVSTDSPEIAAPFNLPEIQSNDSDYRGLKTYLIDNSGYIDYPILGKIKLAGLTRNEANIKLVSMISEYISKPIVNLSIANFKVSVIGEVAKPGSFNVIGERVTILEALGLAQDMTIYGNRKNVLVIRERDGKKSYNRVDLTKPDFVGSPFYYLTQNDVVYVEPNQTKINSSLIGPNVYVIISSLSLLVTITVVLINR